MVRLLQACVVAEVSVMVWVDKMTTVSSESGMPSASVPEAMVQLPALVQAPGALLLKVAWPRAIIDRLSSDMVSRNRM